MTGDPKHIPVGFMVWDIKAGTPYKYTRVDRQVFTTEKAARASRCAAHLTVVPIFAILPEETP